VHCLGGHYAIPTLWFGSGSCCEFFAYYPIKQKNIKSLRWLLWFIKKNVMDRNGVTNTWTHGLARIGDFTSTGSTKKYRQGARESLLVFRAPETPFEKNGSMRNSGNPLSKKHGKLWQLMGN